MISIIIFLLCFSAILTLNLLLFPAYTWQISVVFLFYVLCVIAVNGLIAIVVCKLFPNKWFCRKFYQPSKNECKFYEKIKIRAWKDHILELGALNGFRKNKLTNPNSIEYLEKFILENNKGFLTHFLSIFMAILPLFALPTNLWLPMLLPIALTNFILNFMPMAVLRYNIPRLNIAIRFSKRSAQKKTA